MEYFRNKWVDALMIFVVAFFVGAEYPRNSLTMRAWGYPFVYRWIMKPEYTFPNQQHSYISLFFLAFNVLSLFLAAMVMWYVIGWLIWKVRIIIFKIQA